MTLHAREDTFTCMDTCSQTRLLLLTLLLFLVPLLSSPSFPAQPQTNSTKNSIVTSPKGNIPSPALVFTS